MLNFNEQFTMARSAGKKLRPDFLNSFVALMNHWEYREVA